MKRFEKSTKLVKHKISVHKKVARFVSKYGGSIGAFYDDAALEKLDRIFNVSQKVNHEKNEASCSNNTGMDNR